MRAAFRRPRPHTKKGDEKRIIHYLFTHPEQAPFNRHVSTVKLNNIYRKLTGRDEPTLSEQLVVQAVLETVNLGSYGPLTISVTQSSTDKEMNYVSVFYDGNLSAFFVKKGEEIRISFLRAEDKFINSLIELAVAHAELSK